MSSAYDKFLAFSTAKVRPGFEVQLAAIYMEVRVLETLINCQRSGFLKVSLWSLIGLVWRAIVHAFCYHGDQEPLQ